MGEPLRDTLGKNLASLMARSKKNYRTYLQVEAATKALERKVSKTTIGRVLAGSTANGTPVNLEYVEVLANIFEIEPWQLLVPDLDPENLPTLGVGKAQLELLTKAAEFAKLFTALSTQQVSEPQAEEPRRKGSGRAR